MRAARVYEQGKIIIEEVLLPKLEENDVLIKVHRVGICGTDVGVLRGHVPAKFPLTLGHEFSGTIAELGTPGLGGFKEGDSVTAVGGWGCRDCEFCKRGMTSFCANRSALGRTVDGCLAEFVKVNYQAIYRLPSNVSFDEGQNFLNVACAIRAFKKVPLQLGNKAVIFGAGNMGLIILQIFRLAGASQLAVVDIVGSRLQIAKKFGANYVVNAKRENAVKAVLEFFPNGADVVVEATGNALSFRNACAVIKPAGSLVNVGVPSSKAYPLDISFLYYKEPIIYGSRGGEGGYHEAIQLLKQKGLQIIPMITHRFPLEETAKAFQTFEVKDKNVLRIIIEPTI